MLLCLTKHHAMKTCCVGGGIAPCVLDLGTRRRVVSFTPQLLYLYKKMPHPLDTRLSGPQSWSGCM